MNCIKNIPKDRFNLNNEWATITLKEVPFWRDGMTPEEYDKERTYFFENFDSYKTGSYIPLWQQENKQP